MKAFLLSTNWETHQKHFLEKCTLEWLLTVISTLRWDYEKNILSPKELHLNFNFNFKFQEHMNTDICQ